MCQVDIKILLPFIVLFIKSCFVSQLSQLLIDRYFLFFFILSKQMKYSSLSWIFIWTGYFMCHLHQHQWQGSIIIIIIKYFSQPIDQVVVKYDVSLLISINYYYYYNMDKSIISSCNINKWNIYTVSSSIEEK